MALRRIGPVKQVQDNEEEKEQAVKPKRKLRRITPVQPVEEPVKMPKFDMAAKEDKSVVEGIKDAPAEAGKAVVRGANTMAASLFGGGAQALGEGIERVASGEALKDIVEGEMPGFFGWLQDGIEKATPFLDKAREKSKEQAAAVRDALGITAAVDKNAEISKWMLERSGAKAVLDEIVLSGKETRQFLNENAQIEGLKSSGYGEAAWNASTFIPKAANVIGEAAPGFSVAIGTSVAGSPALGSLVLSGQTGLDTYVNARDEDLPPEEASRLAVLDGTVSFFLEKIGLDKLLKGAGKNMAANFIKGGSVEGFTEVVDNWKSNLIAKFGYDEARKLSEGWFESLIGGVFLGGGTKAVVGAVGDNSTAPATSEVNQQPEVELTNEDNAMLPQSQEAVVIPDFVKLNEERATTAQGGKEGTSPARAFGMEHAGKQIVINKLRTEHAVLSEQFETELEAGNIEEASQISGQLNELSEAIGVADGTRLDVMEQVEESTVEEQFETLKRRRGIAEQQGEILARAEQAGIKVPDLTQVQTTALIKSNIGYRSNAPSLVNVSDIDFDTPDSEAAAFGLKVKNDTNVLTELENEITRKSAIARDALLRSENPNVPAGERKVLLQAAREASEQANKMFTALSTAENEIRFDQEQTQRASEEILNNKARTTNEDVAQFIEGQALRGKLGGSAAPIATAIRELGDVNLASMNKAEMRSALGATIPDAAAVDKVISEIEGRRSRAKAAEGPVNLQSKGIKSIVIPPEIDPSDFGAQDYANQYAAALTRQKDVAKNSTYKMGSARGIYYNFIDHAGAIETQTGNAGIFQLGVDLEQSLKKKDFEVNQFKKGLNDILGKKEQKGIKKLFKSQVNLLSEAEGRQLIDVLDGKVEGEGRVKELADFIQKYDNDVMKPVVKANRMNEFIKNGREDFFTAKQKKAMKPLRELWDRANDPSDTEVSMELFQNQFDAFIRSENSDVLVINHYRPYSHKAPASVDQISSILGESMANAYDTETGPANSKTNLRNRGVAAEDTEYQNPLLKYIQHVNRQSKIYYMAESMDRFHDTVFGKPTRNNILYDGTPESAQPLIDGAGETRNGHKRGAKLLHKQMMSMLDMLPPQTKVEQIIQKAAGNLWKGTSTSFNAITKNPSQSMLTGGVKEQIARFKDVTGIKGAEVDRVLAGVVEKANQRLDETAKRYGIDDAVQRAQVEVFQSEHILSELFAEGMDSASLQELGLGPKQVLQFAQFMTDNKLIDAMNSVRVLGGQATAEMMGDTDTLNRNSNLVSWIDRAGKAVIENDLDFQAAKKDLGFEKLLPWEQNRIAEMFANGQKQEAVWEIAKSMARIGNFEYDRRLASALSTHPAVRSITQYTTWWRGYSMRWYRQMQNSMETNLDGARVADVENSDRALIDGLTLVATMGTLGTVHAFLTGRENDEDNGNIFQTAVATFLDQVDPIPVKPGFARQEGDARFKTGGVGNFQTLYTPVNLMMGAADNIWNASEGELDIKKIESPSQKIQAFTGLVAGGAAASKLALGLFQKGTADSPQARKEAEKRIRKSFLDAADSGDKYLEAFYWGWKRAARTGDIFAGTRNQNWVRTILNDAFLGKEYKPWEEERTALDSIRNVLFVSNPQFQPKEEPKTRKRRRKRRSNR